jgi:hypothetical protein
MVQLQAMSDYLGGRDRRDRSKVGLLGCQQQLDKALASGGVEVSGRA